MVAQITGKRRRGDTVAASYLSQFRSPSVSPASSTLDLSFESDQSEAETAVSSSKSRSPVSAPSPQILPADEKPQRERSNSWSSVKEDRNGESRSFVIPRTFR